MNEVPKPGNELALPIAERRAMSEMLGHQIWCRATDGHLFAVVHGLKLVVRQSGCYARYLILQRGVNGGEDHEIMVASGTEADENAATIAARRGAMRISFMLDERQKQRLQAGVPNLQHTP
jgi:hypothetical protein